MEQAGEEKQQLMTTSLLPVLPRLDRLDRLLELLEEKYSMSRRYASIVNPRKEVDQEILEQEKFGSQYCSCKTLSSALDEVHEKGSLMDRLAMLENRILQLGLEMEAGNTSRSSSSTGHAPEEEVEKDPIHNDASRLPTLNQEGKELSAADESSGKTNGKRKKRREGLFRWIKRIPMGC